jgi:hypothetical protein
MTSLNDGNDDKDGDDNPMANDNDGDSSWQ